MIGFVGIVVVTSVIMDIVTRSRIRRLRQAGLYPLRGEETDADVERLIRMGKMIEAIKVYRDVHGVDLKAAKEAVDVRTAQIGRIR